MFVYDKNKDTFLHRVYCVRKGGHTLQHCAKLHGVATKLCKQGNLVAKSFVLHHAIACNVAGSRQCNLLCEMLQK